MAAAGGGDGYEGRRYSIKRFAYDVLKITLSKCGFPETHLQVTVDRENRYPFRNAVNMIHAGVLQDAFKSRDYWKSTFWRRYRSKGLNYMQNVREHWSTIEDILEFEGNADNLGKIRSSLAFYSEFILFLHSKNIEVDFEYFLDMWCNCFNEKILAEDQDSDAVMDGIFPDEDPHIPGYLRLVYAFIQEFVVPYDNVYRVSVSFDKFTKTVHSFHDKPVDKKKARLHFLFSRLNAKYFCRPMNPITEAAEESIAYLSELLRSPEPPQPLPSTSATGVEESLEQINLGNEGTNPEIGVKTPKDEKPQGES